MKILVIDDHALVREGLHQVLKGLDENVSVLQAGTCAQAFAIADAHPDLDLVLLDYHLPDMTGLQALDVFGKDHPELPIVMLSGSANIQVMRQVLQSGASGFVTKSTLSDELLNAVRLVLNGDVYSPLELEADYGTLPFDAASSKPPLTQRQELVLRELLDGRSNREIGTSLNVSEETVKTHVAAILRYFDVQNRTQAVVAAARSGYRASQVS
ncbi:response regulator transcription factor [Rhodoferax saidenbachensis]|uniref:DNA-binding NarL/FixJ family response regulator n=1 Tax=Rhodoferax saidenbachensis TaxID=1484693 RepID=A0ABU1ZMC9_9BURK|nr:response regulator transcription factor [Rhodoferax saidenbachensis]MDR7306696.1 DNA-binding NarL/FixJ family response regulator [Rhodoferax saidenbachensis]